MSAKLQIVAKQSDKTVLTEELSRVSVCNNPTQPSWSVPDGSFVPSDFGVLMVVVNGQGSGEGKDTIAELTLQAIKYAIHETSDDWEKMGELDVLESSIYFAHEQIISFKRANPEFNNASADVSIALIKNNKIYLSWIGKGGIYKYTEKSFDIVSGPVTTPKMELITQINIINEDGEEPLALSFDEPLNFDSQYSDELGIPSFVPMIKTKVESIYQNDIILGLTDGIAALPDEEILDIVVNNLSSSNQIVHKLLAHSPESGYSEAIVICKVVQGKRLVLPVKQPPMVVGQDLVPSTQSHLKPKKKSNVFLNAFVVTLVLVVVIVQWNFNDRDDVNVSANAAIIEEVPAEEKTENLILLMADESEFGLENGLNQLASNSENTSIEEPKIVEEPKSAEPQKILPEIKKTKEKENIENSAEKKIVAEAQPAKTEISKAPMKKSIDPKLSSFHTELNQIKDKVNMMMDWDDSLIKTQKKNVLKIVNDGIARIDGNDSNQSEKIEQLVKAADGELRVLQRLVTEKLYEE